MTTKIKLYKATCTKSVLMSDQGQGYGLEPWGDDTDMLQGYDDGGHDYLLPTGYHVATSKSGPQEIYNKNGVHCDLGIGYQRDPIIVDGKTIITLQREEAS